MEELAVNLDTLELPTLTKCQQSILDSPLTLVEVQRAAASFTSSKAPGGKQYPGKSVHKVWEIYTAETIAGL